MEREERSNSLLKEKAVMFSLTRRQDSRQLAV